MANPEIGDYEVYADLAMADAYMEFAFHGDTWRALTGTTGDDSKERALVTATRLLNRQLWLGQLAVAGQELAWPRINTGVEGVTDTVIPPDIVTAAIEIALALVDGSEVQNEQNTGQKIQSLQAGSVGITFFRGAEGVALRFPLIVWELIKKYLTGASAIAGIIVSGTDGESVTRHDFGLSGPP